MMCIYIYMLWHSLEGRHHATNLRTSTPTHKVTEAQIRYESSEVMGGGFAATPFEDGYGI